MWVSVKRLWVMQFDPDSLRQPAKKLHVWAAGTVTVCFLHVKHLTERSTGCHNKVGQNPHIPVSESSNIVNPQWFRWGRTQKQSKQPWRQVHTQPFIRNQVTFHNSVTSSLTSSCTLSQKVSRLHNICHFLIGFKRHFGAFWSLILISHVCP